MIISAPCHSGMLLAGPVLRLFGCRSIIGLTDGGGLLDFDHAGAPQRAERERSKPIENHK